MSDDPALLLLAAGSSSRMRGGDKQLERIADVPLLRRMARICLVTDAVTYVALPNADHPRWIALEGLNVTPIFIPNANDGMAVTLKSAVQSIAYNPAVLICPTDMPELGQHHFDRMIQTWRENPDRIIQAKGKSGKSGHPVIFPQSYFARFDELTGDQGAKSIISDAQPLFVTFHDDGPNIDLDTPEDWDAWRLSHRAD